MSETTLSDSPLPDDDQPVTTPMLADDKHDAGDVEVRWEVVAHTAGLVPAQIIAGRLQAEGIMARAWGESAGVALGLTVGMLGTGYVGVPEQFVEEAQAILAVEFDELDEEE